jgi:hypothetical protein
VLTTSLAEGPDRRRDEPPLEVDQRGVAAARRGVAKALVGQVLDDALSDQSRAWAADVVTWLGGDAAEAVNQALALPAPALLAIRLAGVIHDNRLVEPLVLLCDHDDPSRRAAAAHALGQIKDTRGVAALIRLTQDDSHGVREAALAALEEFGVAGVVFGLAAGAQESLPGQGGDPRLALREGPRAEP